MSKFSWDGIKDSMGNFVFSEGKEETVVKAEKKSIWMRMWDFATKNLRDTCVDVSDKSESRVKKVMWAALAIPAMLIDLIRDLFVSGVVYVTIVAALALAAISQAIWHCYVAVIFVVNFITSFWN